VYREKGFECFDLNNDFIINQQVQPVAAVKFNVTVNDRYRFLPLYFVPGGSQFVGKASLVSRSSKPGPRARWTAIAARMMSRVIRSSRVASSMSALRIPNLLGVLGVLGG
jgi:hypothetical protein